MKRVGREFFIRDVLEVAPGLLGKYLVRVGDDGNADRYLITETEAYRGEEDLACHARKGKTPRTKVMYEKGGVLYVYLVYGIHWMLNIVTGPEEQPQAALIRCLKNAEGPGILTKMLEIGKDFNGEDLAVSRRMWIENGVNPVPYRAATRVGIDYAGETWKNKPWRYIMTDH